MQVIVKNFNQIASCKANPSLKSKQNNSKNFLKLLNHHSRYRKSLQYFQQSSISRCQEELKNIKSLNDSPRLQIETGFQLISKVLQYQYIQPFESIVYNQINPLYWAISQDRIKAIKQIFSLKLKNQFI